MARRAFSFSRHRAGGYVYLTLSSEAEWQPTGIPRLRRSRTNRLYGALLHDPAGVEARPSSRLYVIMLNDWTDHYPETDLRDAEKQATFLQLRTAR